MAIGPIYIVSYAAVARARFIPAIRGCFAGEIACEVPVRFVGNGNGRNIPLPKPRSQAVGRSGECDGQLPK